MLEDTTFWTAIAGAATLLPSLLLSQPKVAVDGAESDAMAASPWLGADILPFNNVTHNVRVQS